MPKEFRTKETKAGRKVSYPVNIEDKVYSQLAKSGGKNSFREFNQTVQETQKEWDAELDWKEEHDPHTRRKHIFESTDKRLTTKGRHKMCYHKLDKIAIRAKDAETKQKARADANYFFRKAYT